MRADGEHAEPGIEAVAVDHPELAVCGGFDVGEILRARDQRRADHARLEIDLDDACDEALVGDDRVAALGAEHHEVHEIAAELFPIEQHAERDEAGRIDRLDAAVVEIAEERAGSADENAIAARVVE